MGVLGMIKGQTGTGKSASLEGFAPGEAEIFSVTGKRLPFRSRLQVTANAGYPEIYRALKANASKVYVIDDSTYLMQFDNFKRAREHGYDKFVDMAMNFQTLLDAAAKTDDDTTVWFLHHPQFGEGGGSKPQTVGKMLDNQLCVEGLFDLIFESEIVEDGYVFYTNRHGLAKTPKGMFEQQAVPNDLRAIDAVVREYWGMSPLSGNVDNYDLKED